MSLTICILILSAIVLLLFLAKAELPLPCKLVANTFLGYVSLIFLNLLSFLTGLSIQLNIVTAVIAGFLGLPGIVLLFILRYFLL